MKKIILKLSLLLVCMVLAGPELGIGLEMIGLLNLMSVEIFLLMFSVPLLYLGQAIVYRLEELDPYFFLSPRKDFLECPALIAHAIPFFIASLFVVISSAYFSFLVGE